MKKISIRKIVVFAIYVLLIVLIIIGVFKILLGGKKTLNVKVTDKIENYEYILNSNATEYHKNLFDELSKVLENNDINEKEYAELVSKIFITDLYTLDNKLNKNDIGGTQYVYNDFRDDFNSYAQSSIYKNIINNMYNDRVQELPIVSEVLIKSNEIKSFKYKDKNFENSYYIEVEIKYEKDLEYPKNVSLVLVKNNNKIEVAKMETK